MLYTVSLSTKALIVLSGKTSYSDVSSCISKCLRCLAFDLTKRVKSVQHELSTNC